MRVLIAPDQVRFAGEPVPAVRVAEHLAEGWRAARELDALVVHPLSTGATGLVETVAASMGGEPHVLVGRGPLGEPVPMRWLMLDRTAFLDVAALLGDPDAADAARLAQLGSSAGVGELIGAVVDEGARRVVVGLGESATHDAGIGALRSLAGAGPADPLPDVVGRARKRLRGLEIVVAAATDRPLVGLSGAGAGLAGRPGVDAALAQQLELGLSAPIAQIEAATERPVSLLAPDARERRGSRRAFAGAGGGLAFALDAVGGRVHAGAEVVADQTGLRRAMADADLVITACTSLDGAALALGVPASVGRLALEGLIPAVAVADRVQVTRRELAGSGVEAAYPVLDPPTPGRARDAVEPGVALSQRASRVARTWSR